MEFVFWTDTPFDADLKETLERSEASAEQHRQDVGAWYIFSDWLQDRNALAEAALVQRIIADALALMRAINAAPKASLVVELSQGEVRIVPLRPNLRTNGYLLYLYRGKKMTRPSKYVSVSITYSAWQRLACVYRLLRSRADKCDL